MRTNSIITLLENLYEKKDNYTIEELDAVKSVDIFRMSYTGTLFNVDFSDLDNFKNLTRITIDGCIIDEKVLDYIIKYDNLEKLVFRNCEVLLGTYEKFNCIKTRKLYLINTKINLSLVSGYFDLVVLENIDFSSFDMLGETLDVSKCRNINIDSIVTSNFKKLIVSLNQYYENQIIIDKCKKKIVVMQENNEFVLKEVTI